MKLGENKIKWIAIAVFYVIALIIRAIALKIDGGNVANMHFFLTAWSRGVGPCIGALVAVLLFKRKFFCSITGTSIIKSVLSVAIPFIIVFFLQRKLSYVLLGFMFYAFLEEVGWRGYLQGELKESKPIVQALLIGVLWFFWHIHIGFNLSSLLFLALLIFGSWGIGHIAKDTHSLVACACFHVLYNFSCHGFFEFTPAVICIYAGVVVSWFVIWYTPWAKLFQKKPADPTPNNE